ncbi:MAG TPA: hypothetical protein VMR76_00380 [Candidatus Saccharimonadia bacterium]|nr:hypothetical protein [Candidatus Saccharimonadia bacterium]
MKKLNNKILTLLSLIIISGIIFTGPLVANAATATAGVQVTNNLSKHTLREARLKAEAQVLGKTPGELRVILMNHQLRLVVGQEGFSEKTFREEVRVQMYNDLLDEGFSASEITKALNSSYIKSHRNNF